MPAQQTTQPQAQQMTVSPQTGEVEQQPAPIQNMTAAPVSMRGGEAGEICCGL
ncbi:MAG: hypothetical protein M1818_000028 [Claussenomyces sp. TS43310]|nr:MAG: hypothetical protein M1818_000028 [Claussenomyces sp. TS43310]